MRRFTSRSVELADGRTLACDAVVLATGFTLFDASIKEEYGYGIYDNVFTTVDIERMLNEGRVAKADGTAPRRIAFLHCVGSRDEKVCQQHCSRVCCITGVKQAMEMKRLFPEAEMFAAAVCTDKPFFKMDVHDFCDLLGAHPDATIRVFPNGKNWTDTAAEDLLEDVLEELDRVE